MEVVVSNASSISPTHYSVAKFAHGVFKGQYKCNLVKKMPVWFQKQADETWKKIDDIVIYKRLSTDVVDAVAHVRHNFKKNNEFTEVEDISSASKSLKALQGVMDRLIEKKATLELNNLEEVREVDAQIRCAGESIDMITKKQDLQRAKGRDRVFSQLADVEMKLYNSPFKNSVMKELIGFFYVDE